MPDDFTATIQDVREIMVPGKLGTFAKKVRVTYLVGEDGPFTLEYDPLDFTEQSVRDEIGKMQDKLKAIHRPPDR